MKTLILLTGLTCLAASFSPANSQEAIPLVNELTPIVPAINSAIPKNRRITLTPDLKRAFVLKAGERNPFARRNPDVELITEANEQETESELIRNALNELGITGRSYSPEGLKVLAEGNVIFEAGKEVDPILVGQTETLIVEKLTESHIHLAWIDRETGKLTGKRVTITYDLSPRVRMVMKGQKKPEGRSEEQALTEMTFDRENPLQIASPPQRKEPGNSFPKGIAAEDSFDRPE